MGVRHLIVLLALSPVVHALQITEVFPAPITDETLNEWIEMYNNGSSIVDVHNYILGDSSSNDTLEGAQYEGQGTILFPGQFAIITDQATRVHTNFNVSPEAIPLYVDDASLGNGLSNSGETIYLYTANHTLLHSVAYPSLDRGQSYALINDTFRETAPSPGYPNEELPPITSCDWSISILINESPFSFKIQAANGFGAQTNVTATANIHDLSGNLIKSYKPFTNASATRKKSSSTYSPPLDPGIYTISTTLTTACADISSENNNQQKLVTLEGTRETASSIEIDKILDLSKSQADLGDIIRVRLHIYKGDTGKKTVKLWIEGQEKLTKISSINIDRKFSEYDVTVPLQITDDCTFKSGKYDLIVEGLDASAEEKMEINGCKEQKKPATEKFGFETPDFPLSIESKLTFPVKITNNDEVEHIFTVWSYIYRGSKSYSGDREQNKQSLSVPARTTESTTLSNTPTAEPGDYKVKIKILRDSLKTPTELTKDITVTESKTNETIEPVPVAQKPLPSILTAELLYESKSLKARHLAQYFFMGTLAILALALTFRQ